MLLTDMIWGLIDAMSGFGVKNPLCKSIFTYNFFFNTGEVYVKFSKQCHDDETRYLKLIPS